MSWIQTYTGRRFDPLNPRAEDIDLEDIAHALSNQCRFSGHVLDFYSVAQHSVLVAWWVEARSTKAAHACALMHDASEAYLVDVPRPIKPHLTNYRDLEHGVMMAVARRFDLSMDMLNSDIIHDADEVLLATEKRDLMPRAEAWPLRMAPMDEPIIPWSPSAAKRMFLDEARRLGLR